MKVWQKQLTSTKSLESQCSSPSGNKISASNKRSQLTLNALHSIVQNISPSGVQNTNLTSPKKHFGPTQLQRKNNLVNYLIHVCISEHKRMCRHTTHNTYKLKCMLSNNIMRIALKQEHWTHTWKFSSFNFFRIFSVVAFSS